MLSFAGLLLAGWSAFRIARLDGAPARAGWWAVCLLASVAGGGRDAIHRPPRHARLSGLQTTGAWLILRALQSSGARRNGRRRRICRVRTGDLRQAALPGGTAGRHGSSALGRLAGRVSGRLAGLGVLTAAAIVAAVYVVEELATGGQMSQAIFVAAMATARVHPADWVRGGDRAGEYWSVEARL